MNSIKLKPASIKKRKGEPTIAIAIVINDLSLSGF